MSTPPVLSLPNFSEPLETDARATGLGAVLVQHGQPLAFYSKILGPKTSALSIYEKEALSIFEAMNKWHHTSWVTR
jgi:hypothetical protein